jgi:hypothetical protein
MKPVRLDAHAVEEVRTARGWYEAEVEGLGDELLTDLDQTLAQVRRAPRRFPLAKGVAKELAVRRALLTRFPFARFYLELKHELWVLALAHHRRRPGYWRRRLRTH